MWLEVLRDNPEAWEELKHYNVEDVIVLERVYKRMLPYISNHPNLCNLIGADEGLCPKCGSGDYHRRGVYHTMVGTYQRYRCNACGGWHRGRTSMKSEQSRKNMLVNAI